MSDPRIVHPGPSAYNRGCACEECLELHRRRCERVKAGLLARPGDEVPHGLGGYNNWGCRCGVCAEANSQHCAARKARKNLAAGRPLTAKQQAAMEAAT